MEVEKTTTTTPPAETVEKPTTTTPPAKTVEEPTTPPPAETVEEPTTTPPPAAEKPVNLLDDEPEGGEEPGGGEEEPTKDGEPTEDEIKAFKDSLAALDLGDGVKFDDAAFDAFAPELMKLCGGDGKKAEGLVKAYTEFTLKREQAMQANEDAFTGELVKMSRERFGNDLKKVLADARRGGAAFFGEKIWADMRQIPTFANNPDIIERLALYGRKIAEDTGATAPKAKAPEDTDLYHRMYGDAIRAKR